MRHLLRSSALILIVIASRLAFAQSAGLAPVPRQQFLDANGNPLAGGFVYAYAAGTSTPLATYTDNSGTVANPNPIVLDAAGRATIWLSTSSAYKLRLESATHVIQWTVDGVSAVSSSSGSSTGQVDSVFGRVGNVIAQSGDYTVSQITGAAATNAGNVFSAGTQDFSNAAHTIPSKVGTIASIPPTCTVGEQYFSVDATAGRNLYGCTPGVGTNVWTAQAGGGGGSGSAAGSNTQLQFNSGGNFGASPNLLWDNTSQLLTVHAAGAFAAGIAVGSGYVQADAGFLATPATATAYNAIQAPSGGVAARSITAEKYIQAGTSAGAPSATTADAFHAGALYWDTISSSMQVFNGSGWGSLAGSSPGGSNTNVQYNGSSAFSGSANFTWNNSGQLLTVTALNSTSAGIAVATGYMQADKGFLATNGTATNYNTIQAPGGGMYAKSFTALNYMQVGTSAGVPTLTAGDSFHAGSLYWDTGSVAMQVYNGSAWSSLGGGTGSPGGSDTHVQFNSSGSFAGSGNFTWDNTGQLLTVTAVNGTSAGIAVATGFIQSDKGFYATTGTATLYNAIQAPGGGMAAKSFTATKYIQVGTSAGAPALTSSDTFHAGALYWDTGSAAMQVYDGASWSSLGGGTGSPGGSDTNVQYNSSGSFAGSGNFTWSNSGQLLTVTALNSSSAGIAVATGFVQADKGFYATTGTATGYNAIQAPGGGMAARSFTATKYIQTGSGTTNPTVTTSDSFNPGAMYWNTSTGQEMVYNGSAWVPLSGASPGGSNTQVQFNGSGAFTGSGNLTWNNSGQLLTVTALNSSSAGIAVATGYVQADGGFLATNGTATNYNAIQAPGGGMAAKSFTATKYVQTGFGTTPPPATTSDSFQPGALYYNTAGGGLSVWNGASWVSVASGGGGAVSSVAGTANQVLVNGGTGAATGAITLSLPQSISTASTPTFTGVIAGAFNSTATGSAIGFQNSNFSYQVDGSGNISAAGQLNLTGGGSYKVGGVTVIDGSRNAILQTATASGAFNSQSTGGSIAFQTANFNYQVDGSGNISAAGQLNLTGGGSSFKMGGTVVVDQLRNGTFNALTVGSAATFNGGINIGASTNSTIYVGSFGNFYLRTFLGTPNCSGVQDGWAGYDSFNDVLYLCRGGVAKAH